MLRLGGARVLDSADAAAVRRVLARDPVEAVLVASRFEESGFSSRGLGGHLWGYGNGRLDALCLSGSNLVPVQSSPAATRAFADRASAEGRRCSSIVGRSETVHDLWDALEPAWGPARVIRWQQPVMSIEGPTAVAGDALVQPVRFESLELLFAASVAMFTEEIGVSPLLYDDGRTYRMRVTDLIRRGRSFARIEQGRVVFKAELGAVSREVAQIQGVWVDPALRGRGLAAAGTAAVVAYAQRLGVRAVSLYVNDFNEAARRAYHRVGFRDVNSFASVLF